MHAITGVRRALRLRFLPNVSQHLIHANALVHKTFNVMQQEEIPLAMSSDQSQDVLDLAVGDLVLARKNNQTYLGMISVTNPLEILLGNGHYFQPRFGEIWFRVPSYATPGSLTSPMVSLALANKIKNTHQTASTLAKQDPAKLSRAYNHFHVSQKKALVSLSDLAIWMFDVKRPSPEHLLGVFIQSMREPELFMPSNQSHRSGNLRFRREAEVKCIAWVKTMFRNGQTQVIGDFVTKCRTIIHMRRQQENLQRNDPTTPSTPPHLPVFTPDDEKLLQCVKSFAMVARNSPSPFAFVSLSILSPLEYPSLDKEAAQALLADIGITYPWQNWHLLEVGTPLEGSGIDPSVERKIDELSVAANLIALQSGTQHNKDLEAPKNLQTQTPYCEIPLTPEGLYYKDSCEHIRHDFGNLPVYTIDDADAKEIDDGVSIEYQDTASGPMPNWIHIHIADPSAHIPLAHPITTWAAQRVQTVYFADAHYSMLPKVLASKTCSIGAFGVHSTTKDKNNIINSAGDYVLTFSFKLDEGGKLADFLIRPAIIHNVQKCVYDDLDTFLGWDYIEPDLMNEGGLKVFRNNLADEIIPIFTDSSNQSRPLANNKTYSAAAMRDLKALQKVAQQHFHGRLATGCFNLSTIRPSISVEPYPLPTLPITNKRPTFIDIRPVISVKRDNTIISPARIMIAELMIIAGRVASSFSQQHNIPLPFRSQEPPTLSFDLLKTRSPKSGHVPFLTMLEVLPYIQAAQHTTTPSRHSQMGILDGYTKVTSPLRRYLDLLIHHQLKAALLGLKLPYSQQVLSNMLPDQVSAEKTIRGLQRARDQYWALETLRQRSDKLRKMMVDGQADRMLGVYQGRIERISEYTVGYIVLLWDIGLSGFMKHDGAFQLGDWVQVEVTSVNCVNSMLDLRLFKP